MPIYLCPAITAMTLLSPASTWELVSLHPVLPPPPLLYSAAVVPLLKVWSKGQPQVMPKLDKHRNGEGVFWHFYSNLMFHGSRFFPHFFLFFAVPRDFLDLSSPSRDRTWAPAMKVPSPNHWTARELPSLFTFLMYFAKLYFLQQIRKK